MSTLRRQEPAAAGLKRIACSQVEAAIRSLTRQAGQAANAAQAIEHAHAVLTLIEPDLPRPTVRRDRAILTKLSRGLAAMTEPAVLTSVLNSRYKKTPSDAALTSAVKSLRKRWGSGGRSKAALSSKAGSFNPAIYRLVADMAELRGHMGNWPTEDLAPGQPPRGLRRTYMKARRLANEPLTVDAINPLHNSLSELAIQLGVISKACPTMIKAQRKLLSRASDELLELYHNEVIDKALRAELGKASSKSLPRKKAIAQRISGDLTQDLEAALAETPAGFMKRMQAYWSAWRGQSDAK
ncbi:MAG: hypothetical protein AAGB26_02955 [Planctomycetota bacterium]